MRIKEVSVQNWLNTWMPLSYGATEDLTEESVSRVAFNVVVDKTEREMYVSLREGLNNLLCSIDADGSDQLIAYITAECAPGDGNGFDDKPGLILCSRYAADAIETPSKDKHDDDAEGQFTKAKITWALAEIVVVAETCEDLGAFPSLASSLEAVDEDATGHHKKARHRLMKYAYELLLRQHRAFVPVIYVFRDEARFVTVDHSGAHLSAPFKYVSDLKPLATFLRRYVTADPQGRGFDPTASLASKADHEVFMQLKTRYPTSSLLHDLFDKAATPDWPTYVLRIARLPVPPPSAPPHDATMPAGEYVIGRPQFRSRSIIGSATRCYAAWDRAEQRPVFIKDYWRLSRGLSEYQVYLNFSQGLHPVTNIPTVVGGGDVYTVDFGYQTTQSRMTSTLDGDIFVGERVHTRLVMKEIGRPLESFKDWRELTSVVHDALKAHQMAWVHHGILHRDLSVGNILIYDSATRSGPQAVGLLSDWDLAKTKEEVFSPWLSQESRSGTWQFMSAAVQWWPHKPHLLSDDLESVMHIMNWLVLKYMKTEFSRSSADLANYLSAVFDFSDENGNLCSYQKYEKVRDGTRFAPVLSEYQDHPFTNLLDKLRELCHLQYCAIDPERPTEEHLAACREASTTAPLFTHDTMLNAFREALDNPVWPHIPKLEDQLGALFELQTPFNVSNKSRDNTSPDADSDAEHSEPSTDPASSDRPQDCADADQPPDCSASTISAGLTLGGPPL
ncbi:hypothetical protein PYCCODRAFT_1410479 [Trametes coccinea BRFM310]|uniref:Fungal-type protein kinase domain-containing protein n=1 Tax=Trametes coccinea (strain BRFM310) TaxID=1353009 RepID=A0A1Y2IRJ4_TRAC3|nr:hypothetical protein PYCCODRAFT_1410479 [Trametes coccinea BRFM310]